MATRAATSADADHDVRSTAPSESRRTITPAPSSRTRRTQRAVNRHGGTRASSHTATSSPSPTKLQPQTSAASAS